MLSDRTKNGFKDAILQNLWVDTKKCASLFDNSFRQYTQDLADDLASCFEILIDGLDTERGVAQPDWIWNCHSMLWQAANSLLAAYQTLRAGFGTEAFPIIRYSFELQAIVLTIYQGRQQAYDDFANGKLLATDCITPAKKIFPEFGRNYGLLSRMSHPTNDNFAEFLHGNSDGTFALLVGAGIPSAEFTMARSALVKGLVVSIGLYTAQLHAIVELLVLDDIRDRQYWTKGTEGITWKPSEKVQARALRRMTEIRALMPKVFESE
jgi:hypothetical protein